MAGIAIVLDLLRKNQGSSGQALHSHGLLSASLAASTAAASVAAGYPFAARAFFGDSGRSVAYCDAGAVVTDDYISSIRSASANMFQHDFLKYTTKEYIIEPKPLFSAFGMRNLALTSLRSFLMFYLPLLEHNKMEEDEDDANFLQDDTQEHRVDLVTPFKKSLMQIARETSVVTTRRILERLAIHNVSQRMAWKLLKDAPNSAIRKSVRKLPTHVYFFAVTRTTFRGHLLGVLASWVVQIGIDTYRYFQSIVKHEADENFDKSEQTRILARKVYGTTIRCSSSLIFASIGAGIGSTCFRPSTGQWIGCVLGDFAGPTIVTFCCERAFHAAVV
ncbi:uncharacterized protein LOC124945243 [Impatiens glandulifera]|uniref:uncharacterized protein LOC124945243 n=1 Tax=Impatiens glandulifera TaxID=253017 RepID=UPI001FB0BD05|nr:uncharacterized protein LOC124945243 [Impatiens glandulifera]